MPRFFPGVVDVAPKKLRYSTVKFQSTESCCFLVRNDHNNSRESNTHTHTHIQLGGSFKLDEQKKWALSFFSYLLRQDLFGLLTPRRRLDYSSSLYCISIIQYADCWLGNKLSPTFPCFLLLFGDSFSRRGPTRFLSAVFLHCSPVVATGS